jgi:hypothetical protein
VAKVLSAKVRDTGRRRFLRHRLGNTTPQQRQRERDGD